MSRAVLPWLSCCRCRRGRCAACFITSTNNDPNRLVHVSSQLMSEGLNSKCVCRSLRLKKIWGGMQDALLVTTGGCSSLDNQRKLWNR